MWPARGGYMELKAKLIRPGRYVVRPGNQCGTCGSYPYLWTAQFINAKTATEAIIKASKDKS